MNNELPAYSGVETHCTKCGSNRATMELYSTEKPDRHNMTLTVATEYLERTCVVCHHTWLENTLENSDSPDIIRPTIDKLTSI